MPVVLRIGPYRFGFYPIDRTEPPHVHAGRDRCSAKFWLGPVRLANNKGFGAVELRKVMRIVSEHEALLVEKWREFFSDDN